MAKDDRDPYAIESGVRLRRARKAAGYESIKAFADDTGTDEDNLSNWERGVSLVPAWYIHKLKSIFGIDHNWIYAEDANRLPSDLKTNILTKDRRKG